MPGEASTTNGIGRRGSILDGVRVTQPLLDGLCDLHISFVRGVRNGRKLVLRRCDLSGLDLTNKNVSQAEFMACSFKGASLTGANFRFAQVVATNFDEADLSEADFEKATLRSATFEGANLTRAKLNGVDLRDGAPVGGRHRPAAPAVLTQEGEDLARRDTRRLITVRRRQRGQMPLGKATHLPRQLAVPLFEQRRDGLEIGSHSTSGRRWAMNAS